MPRRREVVVAGGVRRGDTRLVDDGAEGVILGCTEIELLVDPDAEHGVPLFPTTRLHCRAAVDRALETVSPDLP